MFTASMTKSRPLDDVESSGDTIGQYRTGEEWTDLLEDYG